jgi:hypothetical protein
MMVAEREKVLGGMMLAERPNVLRDMLFLSG